LIPLSIYSFRFSVYPSFLFSHLRFRRIRMPSPSSSNIIEQPPQSTLYEQANALMETLTHQLLTIYEQLRHRLCPLWCAMWNKQRPATEPLLPTGLPELVEEPPSHSLEKQSEELKKRLARIRAQLEEKQKGCDILRQGWQKEANALKVKMEELIQMDRESEDSFKEQAHAVLEDLRKKITVVERTREERLAQVQDKISEHRLAMSNVHKEAEASLARVSQAISALP
ncbi:hypothetical protein GOP47_0024145, partial [Adiantum capillus-veneris]